MPMAGSFNPARSRLAAAITRPVGFEAFSERNLLSGIGAGEGGVGHGEVGWVGV
jgi:hypothetical protein